MGFASAGAAAEEAEAPAQVELPSGPGFRQFSFEPTDELIENPERGFYSRVNLLADERATRHRVSYGFHPVRGNEAA